MSFVKRKGPQLPSELLERINAGEGSSHRGQYKLSRKDSRKQERDAKKQRISQHHATKRQPVATAAVTPVAVAASASKAASMKTRKRPTAEELVPSDAHASKKRKLSSAKRPHVPSPVFPPTASKPPQATPNANPTKSASASTPQPLSVKKKKTKPSLTINDILPSNARSTDDGDDRDIARLEGLLGISSGKGYGDEFADDGLDDLLQDVDRIIASSTTTYAEEPPSSQTLVSSDDEGDGENVESLEDDAGESESEFAGAPEDESAQEQKRSPTPSQRTGVEDSRRNSPTDVPSEAKPEGPKPAPSTIAYLPPHLRASQSRAQSSPENVKLERQLKGLLNRMGEQNIENILSEIMALYRIHPRHLITSALTRQILDSITSHSTLLDSFVILHATLVASLHKLIGVDFAAHFVEICISSYETHRNTASALVPVSVTNDDTNNEDAKPGKEAMNLMVLLSELYNFQVISCVLVYDLIRELLAEDISELGVELLIKITRNSGNQMRQDDPSALKDIIQLVQMKVAGKSPRDLGSRLRFMLETLTNLKNNKIKQPAAQAAGTETVGRLRKFLAGLGKKHHVLAHEPLNVSLKDLRAADKKGKWWLVGSAWAGNPLLEEAEARASSSNGKLKLSSSQQPSATAVPASTEEVLSKLARKQGMNTEVRRSIFVAIVSSEDYIDACERLGHLSLSDVQRREIGRVLLHCCGNEKMYNPYYTMIGQHLCRDSHSFQITLQYCLWDFLREIGEKNVGGTGMLANLGEVNDGVKAIPATRSRNVAHAYAWWIAKGSLSLSIFKAISFDDLGENGKAFFREFFAQFLIGTQTSSPVQSYRALSASSAPLPFDTDAKLIQEPIVKMATQHPSMAATMYKFVSQLKWESVLGKKGDAVKGFLDWGREVIKETIREGLDL